MFLLHHIIGFLSFNLLPTSWNCRFSFCNLNNSISWCCNCKSFGALTFNTKVLWLLWVCLRLVHILFSPSSWSFSVLALSMWLRCNCDSSRVRCTSNTFRCLLVDWLYLYLFNLTRPSSQGVVAFDELTTTITLMLFSCVKWYFLEGLLSILLLEGGSSSKTSRLCHRICLILGPSPI